MFKQSQELWAKRIIEVKQANQAKSPNESESQADTYLSSHGSGPRCAHLGEGDSGSQLGDAPCHLQSHRAAAGPPLAASTSHTPSFTFLCRQTTAVF